MELAITPRITQVFSSVESFTLQERLILAKMLIDSVVSNETELSADWVQMGLASFEKDWDNRDDAIYDNWREAYGIAEG